MTRIQLISEFESPDIDENYMEDFLPDPDVSNVRVTEDGRIRATLRGGSCVLEYMGHKWEGV